jgi:hypothetical protein
MKKTVGAVVCIVFVFSLVLIPFANVLAQAKAFTCTYTASMPLASGKGLTCEVKE